MWGCPYCSASVDDNSGRCQRCGGRRPGDDPDVGPEKTATMTKPDQPVAFCPKCEGPMRAGFIAPLQNPAFSSTILPVNWHLAQPKWSFWWGWRTKNKGYPVHAVRCDNCGFLELYARQWDGPEAG